MGSGEIQKELLASIELDAEKVSFGMPDGEVFKVQLRTILEKGNTEDALAYANLIMLRTIAERQGELASAMNTLALAIRAMVVPPTVPSQGLASFTPGAVNEVVDGMFKRLMDLFAAAGMKFPTPGG
jgi:hypothetical protein